MQNQNTLISVIIPVYNGETYLGQAIESILSQDYQPLDIIVIDDGSTDGSASIARSFVPWVRYHYQANAGISGALNMGMQLAAGHYFAFLDADDLWLDSKLTRQIAAFEVNHDLDAVFSMIEQFYSPEMDPTLRQKYQYAQQTMPGYCADTLLIKRDAFSRVGNFDPDLRGAGFLDWFARAKEKGLVIQLVPEVLAKRRIHNTNMGIQKKDFVNKEYTRILKAALDRRRAIKADREDN